MTQESGTTSVFTDDSGTRQRLVTWTVRSVIGVIVIAGLAIVFSLATGVPLPVLGGPLHLGDIRSSAPHRSAGSADQAGRQSAPSTTNPSAAATPHSTPTHPSANATNGSTRPGTSSSVPPATAPSTAPSTKTPGTKANHGSSTTAPKAHPTHTPGTPAATPPGRAK